MIQSFITKSKRQFPTKTLLRKSLFIRFPNKIEPHKFKKNKIIVCLKIAYFNKSFKAKEVTILKKLISAMNHQFKLLIIIKTNLALKLAQTQKKFNNKTKKCRFKAWTKPFSNNNPNHWSLTLILKSILISKWIHHWKH